MDFLFSGIFQVVFGLYVHFKLQDTAGGRILLVLGTITIVVFLYLKNPQKFKDFFKRQIKKAV